MRHLTEKILSMQLGWQRGKEVKHQVNPLKISSHRNQIAFFLHRQDKELKPSWTVFNQSLSSEESEQTAVGYLPIILALAHDSKYFEYCCEEVHGNILPFWSRAYGSHS